MTECNKKDQNLIPLTFVDRPNEDLVICRNAQGVPTAVYGEMVWDLNPLRLKANFINCIRFCSVFDCEDEQTKQLLEEVKYLLFCMIFFAEGGVAGRLSAEVIVKYFNLLRRAARFCYAQGEKPLVGVLSLQDLFTNPIYLASFIRSQGEKGTGLTQRKALKAILMHMVSFGEQRLGYRLRGVFDLDFDVYADHKQHPVIPLRIYFRYLALFSDYLDHISLYARRLSAFLRECKDPAYACSRKCQNNTHRLFKGEYRHDFRQALESHGLKGFFVKDFACTGRQFLSGVVLRAQFYLKMIIHAYTGMRDQEVMRMRYDCLRTAVVRDALIAEDSSEIDPPQIIEVVSSTTKFAGYDQVVSWVATEEVAKAVELAQMFCRELCDTYGINLEDAPLFISPAVLSRRTVKGGVSAWDKDGKPCSVFSVFIESDDLHQLCHSDQERDFLSDDSFSVGSPWPLTTHQFRRSLVFYGSSSGLISLPSMKRQMKHVSLSMTRYYQNGFDKISTVFGYYDKDKGEYVLPKSHVAFDFQMAMPIGVAYDLLTSVFGEESPLFGGVGSYAEKQRSAIGSGISIADLRKETQRLVDSGRMAYRRTLLGGCTKPGPCDSYMLGDVTACLECDGAAINLRQLKEARQDYEQELKLYPEDSGEYQITSRELESLNNFYKRHVQDKGLADE